MRRRRSKGGTSTFTVGLVALIVIAIGTFLGFTKKIPFRSHYEVKAAFLSANNLKKASPVRIAGVEVGKVTKVERASKGANGVLVTMQIQDKSRPRIFLEGNFFVDVMPGRSGDEVAKVHVFPVNQTAVPVQLDQVLTALQ